MNIDNIKNLILSIVVVMLLLGVCITVDYADDTITMEKTEEIELTDSIVINDTHYVLSNGSGVAKLNKAVTEKPKLPLISMWAKPSCRCGKHYSYTWHHRTFVNYCPNCKHYNTLLKNPKRTHEREYTCSRCDSDFCGNCGKEKYSWSSVYLRRA